jgi:hypothetical protein
MVFYKKLIFLLKINFYMPILKIFFLNKKYIILIYFFKKQFTYSQTPKIAA